MLKIIVVVCVAVVTLSNGKPIPENSKVTRIDIPNAITREQFVALAQYAMRIMASRINITLQATPSQNDSNRVRDSVQSTTPKDVKQVDQKLAQSEKLGVDSALTYEPFIRYPQLFPNQFGFDVIPNSQISSTYVPQTDETKKAQNNPFISNVKPVTYVDGEKDERLSNIRIKNLTIERIPSSQQGSPVVSVPFEAVITFSRQKQTSPSKLEVKDQDLVIPTRDPPDDFPPYFDTVLTVAKKTESNNSLISLNQENNLNPVTDRTNEVYADGKKQSMKPMGKRQTARLGDFLEMLGISTTGSRRGRKGAIRSPTPLLPVIEAPGNTSAQKASGVDREKVETWNSGPIRDTTNVFCMLILMLNHCYVDWHSIVVMDDSESERARVSFTESHCISDMKGANLSAWCQSALPSLIARYTSQLDVLQTDNYIHYPLQLRN